MTKSIPRLPLIRSKLEAMLLEFLQAYPDCREAVSVTVRRLDDVAENGANWHVDVYDSGRSVRDHCDKALAIVVPIVQHHFDLAADG